MVRVALLFAVLTAALATPTLERRAEGNDSAAIDAAISTAVGQAKPQDPLPERTHPAVHTLAARWPARALVEHATLRTVIARPAGDGYRSRACLHVPRRRLPRLRDDADDG